MNSLYWHPIILKEYQGREIPAYNPLVEMLNCDLWRNEELERLEEEAQDTSWMENGWLISEGEQHV